MSSFYDLASLVMIPSGKKAGKVYSQKPLSTDGQLDFTRASTATRIGSDGLIEKTRTNELTYSNDFSNAAWTKVRASLTSGQSDPDGGTNAWSFLTDTTATDQHYITAIHGGSGVSTVSITAKANGYNWLRLRIPSEEAYFDLANGVIGSSTGVTSSMESLGDGWYRCSFVTSNASSHTTLFAHIADSDGGIIISGTPSGTDGLLIYQAQLEQGLVATDYIPTTTAAVSVGSVDNMPRLNYTPGSATSCPSLLLEPQRTNLITQSEYFGAWILNGMTFENNSVVSPEGLQNATKLIRPNNTSAAWIREGNISATIGSNQVISVFAKSGSNNILNITYYDQTTGDLFFNYDLSNGTISSAPTGSAYYVDAGIEDYGNGWYRCYAIAEAGRIDPQFQLSVGVNRGGTANSYLYIYGASHEKDVSYLSSYIPTFGATVTRVADACSKTSISGLIGQTEGTIFVKITDYQLSLDTVLFSVSDGSISNYIQISTNSVTGNLQSVIFAGGSGTLLGSTAPTAGQTLKIAIGYKVNDYALYVNGTQIGTLTSKAAPSSLTRSDIGSLSWISSGLQPRPKVAQALLFKTRLSNTQLADLTSIDS